jgi:hypothetical protein
MANAGFDVCLQNLIPNLGRKPTLRGEGPVRNVTPLTNLRPSILKFDLVGPSAASWNHMIGFMAAARCRTGFAVGLYLDPYMNSTYGPERLWLPTRLVTLDP